MAIKKSDLYSSLRASCDELRGGMDASQYKDYVLFMLFMLFIKYISDKYGKSDDFAPPVTIPKGASFTDMIALKGKSDIGDKINTQIIQPLIDARAEHDDILGDAYEYLPHLPVAFKSNYSEFPNGCLRRQFALRVDAFQMIEHYNLEAILAFGFRVRSHRGTQFRQWATARLSEYLVKGFTMDDERLRNPPGKGQTDYFDELLERIRDIRSSERRFYQKVLDIYATSVDYTPDAETSQQFFAVVQNKMHWATHGQTAAEVIAHSRSQRSRGTSRGTDSDQERAPAFSLPRVEGQ